MRRHLIRTLAALAVIGAATFAVALPRTDAPNDPAPKPSLLKPLPPPAPAPAATAAALPDTSALLPAGNYTLRLSLQQDTLVQSAKLSRNGGLVSVTIGAANETLSGTLDAAGNLKLSGGSANDRLDLAATVQNRRASGSAQVGRGSNRMTGSFTLDPDSQARKLQEFKQPTAPSGGSECGFFCKVGKAWGCLKNWSSC